MEDVNKLLYLAFSAIVFCIACLILFFEVRTYRDSLSEVRENYKGEKELYMQYNTKNKEVVTYAELIATLMEPLEYDVIIDGNRISRLTHTTDKIPGYGITNINYIKSYHYNVNGDVDAIIYTKAGG